MLKNRVANLAVSVGLLAAVVLSVGIFSPTASLADGLRRLAPWSVFVVLLCLTAGLALSALRLKLITADLGYSLSLRDAAVTLSVGQLAGNLFFQLAGQMIGRGAVLARRGIPPAASVMITGYERIFALFISLILAVSGATYLFGKVSFDLHAGGQALVKLALGLAAAGVAGAAIAWGDRALAVLRQLTLALALRLVRSTFISLSIQLTTLAAYVIAGKAMAPHIEIAALAAAASVIMFAASLPISLGGWGMREMSAVVALQTVGLPSTSALLLALLIGVLSIALVGATAVLLTGAERKNASPPAQPMRSASAAPDYTLVLDWLAPIGAATAVFFQVYIPAGHGDLNVNLADPVVLVGAALFCLRLYARGWPAWRIPALNVYLLAATVVIVLAYLHGLVAFGWTDWAFTNRLLGWPMLLCYLTTGALITLRARGDGLTILLATVAATGAAIAALELTIVFLIRLGLTQLISLVETRITGFSQNANAFSFVLLMAFAAALVLQNHLRWRAAIMAIVLAALVYAGSRAGLLAVPLMIGFALLCGLQLRPILNAVASAAVILSALAALPTLSFGSSAGPDPSVQWVLGPVQLSFGQIPWSLGQTSSDHQHLATVADGWRMFLAHPLFGAGLGAYMDEQIRSTGEPLVIHSAPMWLLAETGLAGFAVFAYVGWKIFAAEFARRYDLASQTIVLVLVGFGTMAEAHDLLYQRSLWLLLGAALGVAVHAAKESR
jgi:hypothetical protein